MKFQLFWSATWIDWVNLKGILGKTPSVYCILVIRLIAKYVQSICTWNLGFSKSRLFQTWNKNQVWTGILYSFSTAKYRWTNRRYLCWKFVKKCSELYTKALKSFYYIGSVIYPVKHLHFLRSLPRAMHANKYLYFGNNYRWKKSNKTVWFCVICWRHWPRFLNWKFRVWRKFTFEVSEWVFCC